MLAEISSDGKRIACRVTILESDMVKSIPGAKWHHDDRTWYAPLSWSTCLALRSTFKDELIVGPLLTAWAADHHARVITPGMALRDAMSAEGDPDLFPHQRADVQFLSAVRRGLLASEVGVGKGVLRTTRVLTPRGWCAAGEITVGDAVIGSDGIAVKVVGVYPQPQQQVYRVTFSDGVSVVTDGPHLWGVQTPVRKWRGSDGLLVLSTQEMYERGVTRTSGGNRIGKWQIPMLTQPVVYDPVADLPTDPYLLGVVLGDGSHRWSNGARDTWAVYTDHDILVALGALNIVEQPGCWRGRVYTDARLGLGGTHSWEKFIPDAYLRAAPLERLALLQGLLDTDGSPIQNGGVEFSTTSKALAEGVVELAQSLGGIARWNAAGRMTTYTHNGEKRLGRLSWRVNVKLPAGMLPFRLARKLDKWIPPTKFPVSRTIRSIEPEGEAETVCFTVDAEDSLFVIEHFVVTHNTAATVRTLVELARRGEDVFPVLVVCPNSVKQSWAREIQQWWPGTTVQVISGSAAQRRKQFASPAHFRVINYEALRSHSRIAPYGSYGLRRCVDCGGADPATTTGRCQVHERELNEIPFRTVIADEAHRIKDPSAIQTRALKAAAKNAEFRYALTGTPIANNVVDLWSILNFIDPVEWPGKTRWLDHFADITYDMFGGVVSTSIRTDKLAEFEATLHPHMRRMTKEVVLPFLPPVTHERRDVAMTPKQEKAYKEMSEKMLAMLDGDDMLVATSTLTAALRLGQLASSYGEIVMETKATGEEIEKFVLTAPSSKIDAFLEDLDDYEGSSLIVFAASRQLIMLLSAQLDKRKIAHGLIVGGQLEVERQAAIDDFQAGKTKMILVTLAAGGTGITLTAADTAVYLQRSWSMLDMTQAAGRYHRIGSERHASISRIDYVTPGTIEEAVIGALAGKNAGLEELVKDRELLAKASRGEDG